MNKTFQQLSAEFNYDMVNQTNTLANARTKDDVDAAAVVIRKTITDYIRDVKALIDDSDIQLVTDHAKIMTMLNERFGLDPDKASVNYQIMGNTVRWTIVLYGKEKHFFISKRDLPVDMNKFYSWCLNILT